MKMISVIKRKTIDVLNGITYVKRGFGKYSLGRPGNFVKSGVSGFYPISSILYNFKQNDSKEYVSDWTRFALADKLNGSKRILLDDKLVYHLMNNKNEKVPKLLALSYSKKLFQILDTDKKREITFDDFLESIKAYKYGVILKPQRGSGGFGISIIQFKNNNFEYRGSCKSYEDVQNDLNSDMGFIITEVIHQTGFAHDVHPTTLNTIRVLTMMDPDTNIPFIATAVQRFGTIDSRIVDNWGAGGISVGIDVKKGTYGMGATYPKNKIMNWHKIHPDTKVEFYNRQVPNWDMIRESVLNLSLDYFFLPYIGWDIVPMENGFMVLEGNTNSDVNLLQIHGGLLKEPTVRKFYNYHNISM